MIFDEPRSMTRVDAAALTVGSVLSLLTLPAWLGSARGFPWGGVGMFLRNSAGFWVAAVGLGVATLARSVTYRRPPRAPEWMALVGLAWGLAVILPPGLHEGLVQLFARVAAVASESELAARWTTAAVMGGTIALGLDCLRRARDRIPPWGRTAGLAALTFVALWSPLAIVADHGADLLAPSAGFGRGNAMILYRGACQWAATTPLALLVGLPVVATIVERLAGRRWSWLEWSAAITAGLAGLLASIVYRGEFRAGTTPWLFERALAAAWVAFVAGVDLLVLRSRRGGSARDRPQTTDFA